ncbi:UTRA domain-containing protein [Frankia sp. AgB32]|uniref:UTRA domain-containing protein n=1 Tax=Frankia sp. AgB32 TaxID=631119 RepID=UPI0020104E7B|nr:UTRA domain-containing protein [Frankia sp. AgB32]MCK9894486.1 UTRA domain-containing protein [Frankia sp. AgB32]
MAAPRHQLLTEEMAGALDAEPRSASLVLTRRHLDRDGRLARVGIHTHPADRYRISTRGCVRDAGATWRNR